MTALRFTETMKGYVALGEQDFQRGYDEGKRRGAPISMRLELIAPDLDGFLRSRERLLEVGGEVSSTLLGGQLRATGTVNQLIDVEGDRRRKSMPYRLELNGTDGRRLVLSARKDVVNDPGPDAWRDTTTLYVKILDEGETETIGAGIVHIGFVAFLRQFPTYRLSGGSRLDRALAFPRFYGSFLARLWQVYGPRIRDLP